MEIEREATERGPDAGGWRRRRLLAGAGALGLAVIALGSDRLPGWVLYWRERGDRRSLGVIADPQASARLTRTDWVRFAESLQ